MPDHIHLKLDNISKRYNVGAYVISEFSYEFQKGSATALIGPNGSGKTTLLRLLSVSAFPTSGRIKYGESDIFDHPHQYLSKVGIVHDQPDLPNYLSTVELLEWVIRNRGLWNADAHNQISVLLDRLLLDERRNNLIGTYSSGMMKKAQIAAALITKPPILLLDEPFKGLDEESKQATIDLLKALISDGRILVISSHIKATLEPICNDYISFPLDKKI